MNEYTTHMIKRFYQSYVNQTFDQDDVTLFIISARDYCAKKKSMREIGDFIAHPAVRDRGLTLSSVTEVTPQFEKMLRGQYSKDTEESDMPFYKGIGTQEDLLEDLASIFERAGAGSIDPSADSPAFRGFLFCVIFLLSKFSIKLEHQHLNFEIEYSKDLNLNISYESTYYPNHFAKLTVIRVRDVWKDLPYSFLGYHSIKVPNHIARRFSRGFLCAVPYTQDLKVAQFEDEHFEEGTMFPISD
jgi:hypothetical protein